MFRFAHPYFFFLAIPLLAAAWFVYRRGVRRGLLFSPVSNMGHTGATLRTAIACMLPVSTLVGLLLTILALARPQTVFSRMRHTADMIAIEMVVDVSGSMEALDLSIRTAAGTRLRTRLDAVRDTFAEFIELRPDDMVGLVTFGGYASTRAPLTTDHAALLHVLQGVEIPKPSQDKDGQIVNQEELLTAIGDALATACARMEQAEPKSRIIVLLSDGESNTGIIKPEEAMRIARKLGIKVYTIGVGSTGMAPFRTRDVFGREVVRQARVTLDEKLLKRIASVTGGRYFNVRDPKGLGQAMKDIDELEKTEVERTVYSQYRELFPWFLFPGLGLLVLGTSLNMVVSRRIV